MSVRLAWAFLAALALILVPLAMAGGDGRAMAHGVAAPAAAADHCGGEMPADHDKQDQGGFKTACANACAACVAALPASEVLLPQLARAADAVLIPRLSSAPQEAETPPPRAAPEL